MSNADIDFLEQEAPELPPEVEEAAPVAETVEPPVVPAPEVPTAPEPPDDRVPMAALIAERKKRQEYEARLRQMEQPQQEMPNFYEAPEQYVQTIVAQERRQMQISMVAALEAQARETYADYDDVFVELEEQAASNPALLQQIIQSPNPAMAAYKLGKQLRELKAMQDPDAYRHKVEAELRAKIEAEYAAKDHARQQAAAAIPPDLAAARASRSDEAVPDDSLDSILQSKKR